MKLILLGASGMVGAGALRVALEEPGVDAVLSIGRRPCGVTHPKLRELLLDDLFDIANAAVGHLRKGVALNTLMGSSIDAAKLVSSMTLFGEVARTLPGSGRTATTDALANTAEAILAAAASQGYPRCDHTLRRLLD